MNYEEVIKLLDQGFTREEILKMNDPTPEDKPEDPASEDKPDDAPVSMDVIMSEVKEMFAEMRKELTAMNILNSRQSAEENKTSEDILATIINPTAKSGGK